MPADDAATYDFSGEVMDDDDNNGEGGEGGEDNEGKGDDDDDKDGFDDDLEDDKIDELHELGAGEQMELLEQTAAVHSTVTKVCML